MQEISVRLRRLLGYDGKNEESHRIVPATLAATSKRLRDPRDDDPPAMKKYCNVSNDFPKIMPTEGMSRRPLQSSRFADESWRTPAPTPRVRFVPVTKEDDRPSASFVRSRLNPIGHSSPLSEDKFATFPSYREIKTKSPTNDSPCACTRASVDRKNLPVGHSRLAEEPPVPFLSRFNSSFNDSNFPSRRSTDNDRNFGEEVNGVDDDDETDDDVKCLGVFRLRDGAVETDDVIDLSDDAESYELILKPKVSKKRYDSTDGKLDVSNSKFKNFFKCQNRHRQPSYFYTLFPRKSTKSLFKSPKSITKPRVSLLDSSPLSRNDRWVDSQRGVVKSFRLEEKKLFQELIQHTLSNRSQSNYAKRLQDIYRKEADRETPKGEVIDLTDNLYPPKLSNGTSKSVNSTQNKKINDNSRVTNQEQSDPELVTSADESSTTSSIQSKHKNSLEILLRHNQILYPTWLDNLNKKYGEISLHKEQEVNKIQEEKEEPELPCLTDEQEIKIDRALKPVPPDETLVEKFNSSIRRRDIQTLHGLNWLNDEIINFYVNLIMERSQVKKTLPKVYSTNSFFLQRLMKDGHASLRRWTRKVDIFSHDLMVIPVHLGVHWCMSIINFKEHTIKYYDSMGGDNKACCKALLKYLEDEKMDKKKEKLDSSIWHLECVKDIPQQMNGSDCGMFSCMFAEYISRNVPISFSQNDMPYFRRKMVLEIIEGRLLM